MANTLNRTQMRICKKLNIDWQTYEAIVLFEGNRTRINENGEYVAQITKNELEMCNKRGDLLEYISHIIDQAKKENKNEDNRPC